MIPKAQHLWRLNETSGSVAYDFAGTANGSYSPAALHVSVIRGMVGAVHIDGSDGSFVTFGNQAGQFGTNNFSVALWFKTSETSRYFDIIGNRTEGSHGNFFCIRMTGKHESWPEGMITTEVDDNGKNYIWVQSSKTGLNDGQWHHLAVVRNGVSLKLFIDGALSGQGTASGVASISNGNDFRLGRSLVGVHDKFAPDAEYTSLYLFDRELTDEDILSFIPKKPCHQWKLNEPSGHMAVDSAGSVQGLYSPEASHVQAGPHGEWVAKLDGSDHSYIEFLNNVGQFGLIDFSVSFWINTAETLSYFDLLGNRTTGSHGNFFGIRMSGKHPNLPEGQIIAEIDDITGQNYIHVESNKTKLNDGKWHHVTVVRQVNSLSLYIDAQLSDEDKAVDVANINNKNRFVLGRSLADPCPEFTPVALYYDLRIYDVALTGEEVLSLIPIP